MCLKIKRASFVVMIALFVSFFFISATPAAAGKIPKGNTPPVSPDWVFDHWVWEDDVNTQQAVMDLVNSYAERGIPVGAVIIDSPWATEYNNFFGQLRTPDRWWSGALLLPRYLRTPWPSAFPPCAPW